MPLNHDWADERWEAEYWDDILKEFGNVAYAEVRYGIRAGNHSRDRAKYPSSQPERMAERQEGLDGIQHPVVGRAGGESVEAVSVSTRECGGPCCG